VIRGFAPVNLSFQDRNHLFSAPQTLSAGEIESERTEAVRGVTVEWGKYGNNHG
jgi:hypothetical protein